MYTSEHYLLSPAIRAVFKIYRFLGTLPLLTLVHSLHSTLVRAL